MVERRREMALQLVLEVLMGQCNPHEWISEMVPHDSDWFFDRYHDALRMLQKGGDQ